MDAEIIIRPPSEASSLLLPVTAGCSHNRCTFCGTYTGCRFRVLEADDVKSYIDRVAGSYAAHVRRVFLENGDALIAPQARLVEVLQHLRRSFPDLERVGTYASPRSVLAKSDAELQELRALGLKMAYLGVETGDEELLKKIQKGSTREEIVTAGRRLKQAGIITSVTVILGLGGVEGSQRHAAATGEILTAIDPDYAGALTLMLVPGTPLHDDWQRGEFSLVSPFQALAELKLMVENADFSDCLFTANHASNYLPIRARLPQQKGELIRQLDDVLASRDISRLRPESSRAL